MEINSKPNQPLVRELFTADPSVHVFEDKLYIYPSHDLDHDGPDNDNGDQYRMEDYHVYSMEDITAPCIDCGEVLHKKNVNWVGKQMWAPDALYKNGLYYLVFPARDKDDIFRIGIATSKYPFGPFNPQPDYIPGSYSIDPAIYTDDDSETYLFFGGLWGGQLEKWQTGVYLPDAVGPKADEPALGPVCARLSEDLLSFKDAPFQLTILDKNGSPLTAGDEERRFFEGPWVHKYNDTYYLSYSTGSTHYLVYATSKTITGPYTFQGRLLEPVIGWTTHHSIVEFKGKWYLFYHDSSLSGGVNHKRCIKYTEIHYLPDGSIETINPYE